MPIEAALKIAETPIMFDIEPPLVPAVNWMFWAESGIWLVIGLLLVWVLFKGAKRFYRPAYLRWQLLNLRKAAMTDDAKIPGFIPSDQAWLLYGWCLQLQALMQVSDEVGMAELEGLMSEVNALSFSGERVSRETYGHCIETAQGLLQSHCGASAFGLKGIAQLKSWFGRLWLGLQKSKQKESPSPSAKNPQQPLKGSQQTPGEL
jgi:hypothetical protein